MTTEERIVELENNCKAMSAELEKLKAERVKKNKRENETVWQPKRYDTYMYIGSNGCVFSSILEDPAFERSQMHMYYNNVYQSNNKTQEHLNWYVYNVLRVQNKLMQLHELLCPDYFPNWENADSIKFYLYYNYKRNVWNYNSYWCYCAYVVYFTEEAAEKACEILNREKFMMNNV